MVADQGSVRRLRCHAQRQPFPHRVVYCFRARCNSVFKQREVQTQGGASYSQICRGGFGRTLQHDNRRRPHSLLGTQCVESAVVIFFFTNSVPYARSFCQSRPNVYNTLYFRLLNIRFINHTWTNLHLFIREPRASLFANLKSIPFK